MQVRFHRVRGSVPWATPAAMGHGCNAPCLQITDETPGRADCRCRVGHCRPGRPHARHTARDPAAADALYFGAFYSPGWEPTIYAPALPKHDRGWLTTVAVLPGPYDHLPNRPAMEIVGRSE